MIDPAVAMWAECLRPRGRPKIPRPHITPCVPAHDKHCNPHHRAMVLDYRDARDARNALRESGAPAPAAYASGAQIAYHQLEDADFDQAVPPVTFKSWLIDHRRPA